MRGAFRTGIAMFAIAILLCGAFIGVGYATFTSHHRGVANITINSLGKTDFAVTSTTKYYPGCQDGRVEIAIKYGVSDSDLPVNIQEITLQSIEIGYQWLPDKMVNADGIVTLSV
ncbi:MAG: hypothetical protein IKC79_02585, partial [Clostridia bacterium]|nr:hypothetical protein [Clostridia bacterium]